MRVKCRLSRGATGWRAMLDGWEERQMWVAKWWCGGGRPKTEEEASSGLIFFVLVLA